ncbi:response regulator transcription factor [bacterium]|nr:MAG: response regulator transcription factor [bacterium]
MKTITTMRQPGIGNVRLTKRETEVLSLVAQGLTSQEVADQLFLSARTVSYHLAQVYAKLEVSNRVQAFRVASRMGLIPEQPHIDFM